MPIDFLEPILNQVYLLIGIVGSLGSFIGWLYYLNKKKRDDDKKEIIDYVDGKFKTVYEHLETQNNTFNAKLDHSIELLTRLVNYENKNIKLHIRNLTITDERMEADIARIEGAVFFSDQSNRLHSNIKKKHKYQDNGENNDNGS